MRLLALRSDRAQDYGSVLAALVGSVILVALCYDLRSSAAAAVLVCAAIGAGGLSVWAQRGRHAASLVSSAVAAAALLAPAGVFLLLRDTQISLISTAALGSWAVEREPAAWALTISAGFYVVLAALTQRPALAAAALIAAPAAVLLMGAQPTDDLTSVRNCLVVLAGALLAAVAQRALGVRWEAASLGACAVLLVSSRLFVSLTPAGEVVMAVIIALTTASIHSRAPSALSWVAVAGATLIGVDLVVDLSQHKILVIIALSGAALWGSLRGVGELSERRPSATQPPASAVASAGPLPVASIVIEQTKRASTPSERSGAKATETLA